MSISGGGPGSITSSFGREGREEFDAATASLSDVEGEGAEDEVDGLGEVEEGEPELNFAGVLFFLFLVSVFFFFLRGSAPSSKSKDRELSRPKTTSNPSIIPLI